jgi:hypothetical protein
MTTPIGKEEEANDNEHGSLSLSLTISTQDHEEGGR